MGRRTGSKDAPDSGGTGKKERAAGGVGGSGGESGGGKTQVVLWY